MSEEDGLQKSVAMFLRVALPDNIIWWHTPNGGSRNMREAVKLKAMGTRAGVPDIALVFPGGNAAFIELKTSKGRLSPEQKKFRDQCHENQILWELARSLLDVQSILIKWGINLKINLNDRGLK